MNVLNLPKKLLSKGSDPGNQQSKIYFYKLYAQIQISSRNPKFICLSYPFLHPFAISYKNKLLDKRNQKPWYCREVLQ